MLVSRSEDRGRGNTYLSQKEPRISDNRIVENGKHQEHAPSNILNRVRRHLRHHKVEQPLRRRPHRHAHFARATREDFSHVQPWQWTPGHIEAEGLGISHDDHGDARVRRSSLSSARRRFRWMRRQYTRDDEHKRAHRARADHERDSSPDPVHDKQLKDTDPDHLDHAEEPRHQLGRGARADRREDLRRIVRQRGVARQLRTQLDRDGNEDPVPIRRQQQLAPGPVLPHARLLLEPRQDLVKLLPQFGRLLAAAHPSQRIPRGVSSPLGRQPPRALLDRAHARQQQRRRQQLQPQRDLPLFCCGRLVLGHRVRHPVRDHHAARKEPLETRPQPPAELLGRHLRRIHGDQHRRGADPHPGNHAAGVKGAQGVRVDYLQDRAEREHQRADDQSAPAAQPRGHGSGEETSEKRASLQDRNSIRVDGGFLRLSISKVLLEGFQRENAACQSSISWPFFSFSG